jgi:hypothetical protein
MFTTKYLNTLLWKKSFSDWNKLSGRRRRINFLQNSGCAYGGVKIKKGCLLTMTCIFIIQCCPTYCVYRMQHFHPIFSQKSWREWARNKYSNINNARETFLFTAISLKFLISSRTLLFRWVFRFRWHHWVKVVKLHSKLIRDGIFKLIRRPAIKFKESIRQPM